MDSPELNSWIATIAWNELNVMKERYIEFKESLEKSESSQRQGLKHKYNEALIKRKEHINKILEQMYESAIVYDSDEDEKKEVSLDQIKSIALLLLGKFAYFSNESKTAFDYLEKSFSLFSTQEALYYMAHSLASTSVKTGSFSGKKGKLEEQDHEQKILRSFLHTIKIDAFSAFGIESGKYLLKNYSYKFSQDELG